MKKSHKAVFSLLILGAVLSVLYHKYNEYQNNAIIQHFEELINSRWGKPFSLSLGEFDDEIYNHITHQTGINLPLGSVGHQFSYSPPIDPAIIAKIEIPYESITKLTAHLKALHNEDKKINSTGGLVEQSSWWYTTSNNIIVESNNYFQKHQLLEAAIVEIEGKYFLFIDHSM